MTAPARGGEGGGGGGGEGGEGEGGGGGGGGCRRRNFTARPWGSFMGSHRGTPPPRPPTMALLWGGVSGEGIKRWGIEGIRIGTSDRFGRGRGELLDGIGWCCHYNPVES